MIDPIEREERVRQRYANAAKLAAGGQAACGASAEVRFGRRLYGGDVDVRADKT